jgi:hypothetical protein
MLEFEFLTTFCQLQSGLSKSQLRLYPKRDDKQIGGYKLFLIRIIGAQNNRKWMTKPLARPKNAVETGNKLVNKKRSLHASRQAKKEP